MKAIKPIALGILAAVSLFAQSSPLPQFEVASIRPSTATPQGQVNVGLQLDGGQVRVASMTLRDYLGIAFRTKISNIAGPDWIASDRFDISATIPAGNKTAQIPEMFQSLLAERFHLKFHREKRDFPLY